MHNNQRQLGDRLRLLTRKHKAMARGYVTRIQADGLIVARPRPRRRPVRIPKGAIILFLAGFFAFKGLLLAHLGPADL